MKNAMVREWLKSAASDLAVIERISGREDLTHMVAFHAQQCVEKSLKAAAERFGIRAPKTHSLDRIFQLLSDGSENRLGGVARNQEMIDLLDDLYIDARYPGEMGLLPDGMPTIEEAAQMHGFAVEMYQALSKALAD